jgi:epoxyqueuosine reductase
MLIGYGIKSLMQDTAQEFKAWLRAQAQAVGFARVGFASCEPFEGERDRLAAWFARGGATHLPYLSPEAMLDPQAILPGARTALVGFFPYARPDAVPGAAPGSLKLSRYVWGPDYHMILKPRLSRLLEAAQARWPGLQGRVCVDTAPLLERQLAARAGLGWQGKHTLLIAGKDGSWGFLGALLLDVDLPPDTPFTHEHCGTCTACLEACPSGALTPFSLNPNRCLTTYTIETEAEPPPEVALAIQDSRWAAGCDACQEACPWNAKPIWGDPALWGGPSPLHTQPAEALELGASQWRKHTRRTALRRVRDRHWRRTVRIVLGVTPTAGTPAPGQSGP